MVVYAAGSQDTPLLQSTVGKWSLLGPVLAPSFGHWYAHSVFTRGLIVRVVASGMLFLAAAEALGPVFGPNTCSTGAGDTLALGGAVLFVAGTIDDIVTAPRTARHYNEQHRLAIAPILRNDRSDNRTFGLALTGQF